MPPPPRNKALLRESLNKALLGPYFLGGVALGGSPWIAMKKVIEFCEEFVGSEEAEKLHQWAEYLGRQCDGRSDIYGNLPSLKLT